MVEPENHLGITITLECSSFTKKIAIFKTFESTHPYSQSTIILIARNTITHLCVMFQILIIFFKFLTFVEDSFHEIKLRF